MKLIRTEAWPLAASSDTRVAVSDTIALYRRYVRALSTVCLTHWSSLGSLSNDDAMGVVERMIHPTKQRPIVRYRYFHQVFYKFPSYYRRAAVHDALGAVQSFLTRYDQWQTHEARKSSTSRPPRFQIGNVYPSLYKGQCIKYADDLKQAEIKVYQRGDWVWRPVTIRRTGPRAQDVQQKRLSPELVLSRKGLRLCVPHEQRVTLPKINDSAVCAVDIGINTSLTASIVRADGTVKARCFLHRVGDRDRMHKRLDAIRQAAKQTKRIQRGFCLHWYRKAYHIAENSAHHLSRELVRFAHQHGVNVMVFEHLKGWRPKGPRKAMRQRFHTWFHRRLVKFSESKWEELGGRVRFVSPRHTSAEAYDGSGRVTRGINGNYSLCRFQNGKVYNADLNASYNIAAKYLLRRCEASRGEGGKSPASSSRIPITLSLLWDSGANRETATQCAA